MVQHRFTSCFVLCAALATATAGSAAVTELVSVAAGGGPASAGSTFSSVSLDGRFVAFTSGASDLVAGDTNGVFDVFVRDRLSGTTGRVSVDSTGAQSNGMSTSPSISGDGRFVSFVSSANNLVPGDTNNRLDVFVHDRDTGETTRVSVDSFGAQTSSDSLMSWISNDGNRVAFASAASTLVPGDTNATFDVFVHDRPSATTVRVSVDSLGNQANGPSLSPRISGDGLVVVFHSAATNLVASDLTPTFDVFVHDLSSGATEMVSVDSANLQGNLQSVAGSLSSDGRFVAFDSESTNLVPGDTNFRTDVFLRDRQSGTTTRVSVGTGGVEGDGQSGFVDPPAVSADGRFVAFASGATNLVSGDSNNFVDMFLHDRASGTTERVSVASDGTEGNMPVALWPSVSADGSVVVFASLASNLVPGDTNFSQDVFASVRADLCGNGTLDTGEECDDGNVDDGDCCASTCTFEPPGSACDDGESCTTGDACSTGTCVAGTFDPESCVDAMRCYSAYPKGPPWVAPFETPLADAFQDGVGKVKAARGLCAPTDLDGGDAALAQDARLACHDLSRFGDLDSLQGRKVTVRNRFGDRTLRLFRPEALCLGAGADAAPEPGSPDHFTCYQAVATDWWWPWLRGWHKDPYGRFDSNVGRPVELCTPAALDGAAASHPDAHLVCYSAWDRRFWSWGDFFKPRKETVHHVLGSEKLQVLGLTKVCVPSEILD